MHAAYGTIDVLAANLNLRFAPLAMISIGEFRGRLAGLDELDGLDVCGESIVLMDPQ